MITKNMVRLHFRRHGRQPQGKGGTDAFLELQEVVDPAADLPALKNCGSHSLHRDTS